MPYKKKYHLIRFDFRLINNKTPIIILSGILFLLTPIHPWPTILISSFGFFLLLQSFTLKLKKII